MIDLQCLLVSFMSVSWVHTDIKFMHYIHAEQCMQLTTPLCGHVHILDVWTTHNNSDDTRRFLSWEGFGTPDYFYSWHMNMAPLHQIRKQVWGTQVIFSFLSFSSPLPFHFLSPCVDLFSWFLPLLSCTHILWLYTIFNLYYIGYLQLYVYKLLW